MEAIGKKLPSVSPEEASMATTLLGGVLMNLLLYHVLHLPAEHRFDGLKRAVATALDGVKVGELTRGTEQERTNTKTLVSMIISQAHDAARVELTRRQGGERDKIN